MAVEELEQNLAELFRTRSAHYASAVRWRQKSNGEWHSATWLENQRLVNSIISGLDALGAALGDKIGIMSNTRWEWQVADWAILGLGAVTVTLYPSNTPDTIADMLENSKTRFLFVENREQYEKVLSIRSRIPEVSRVIVFDTWEQSANMTPVTPVTPVTPGAYPLPTSAASAGAPRRRKTRSPLCELEV